MHVFKRKKNWFMVAIILSLVWITGCGAGNNNLESPASAPADTAAVPADVNNTATTPDSGTNETPWENYVKKAKEEGTVTVVGSNSPEFRQKATEIMKEKYGITLKYLTLANAEAIARIEREASAGQTSIDVVVSGTTEIVQIPELLAPIDDKFVMPEVADAAKWKTGGLKWIDKSDRAGKTSLQITQYVYLPLWVNTKSENPETLKWSDLLDPKYKGKIVVFDPRGSGQGQLAAMYLLNVLGEDYVKKLYVDQEAVVSTDGRQMAGWLASGKYTVAVGLLARDVASFLKENLPISPVSPSDGPGFTNGKIMKVIKDSPNPNAAIVFANWLASKEGMELFSKSFQDVSLRNDVDTAGIPEFLFPKDNVEYPDFATEEFYTEYRPQAQKLLIEVLGR